MGDGIRIPHEKRHRSSSSLAGVLEGVRSEKKLDVRASISEVDDEFALAEARCDSLQEKIDLVKVLKRKKKLKKRSMTTITEPVSTMTNIPLINFRSRPKKKVTQQPESLRRLEPTKANPMRGYVDPDVIEQQQMLSRVHGNRQTHQEQHRPSKIKSNRGVENVTQTRMLLRRPPADGDSEQESMSRELRDDDESSDDKSFNEPNAFYTQKREYHSRPQSKQSKGKRHISIAKASESQTGTKASETERRQVVELFKKNEARCPRQLNINIAKEMNKVKDNVALYKHEAVNNSPTENAPSIIVKKPKVSRNIKYRNRHYELPTVSSKMKRVVLHCYSDSATHAVIPFVVSKSSAPSHNVGVNLQQILNGLRVQQPISKIPLTIAHHMGLRHIPTSGTKSTIASPTLQSSEMNVIKLGQRLLHLPSFKTMSYNRLLSLYREGNSLVSRFLCANGRPHYFYTSMCDLTKNPEDNTATKSKRRSRSQGEKQTLLEYVALFREYDQIEKRLNQNYDPDLEKHKETLEKKLNEREKYIRKIVRDTGEELDVESFRATIANEGYQHLKSDLLSTQLH